MAKARTERAPQAKATSVSQRKPSSDYGTSRRAALQRMADLATVGEVHQRAALEEQETLQGKAIQRADLPEEEELQMKQIQRESLEEEEPLQGKAIQRATERNNTGLPDGLKAGIETLSGHAMDSVRVHFNSAEPGALQAHAFAQGNDIHVAPGQEQHLPHEAWHVVQQAQGRVAPTTEVAGQPVNDDAGLEREADVMGQKAALSVQRVQSRRSSIDSAEHDANGSQLGPMTSQLQRLATASPVVSRLQRLATLSAALQAHGNRVRQHAGGVLQRMTKPVAENGKLNNIINNLFKGAPAGGERIGDGSAMAAANHEANGNPKVGGRDHIKKLEGEVNGLEKLLDRHENPRSPFQLSDADYETTEMLFRACNEAMVGHYDGDRYP